MEFYRAALEEGDNVGAVNRVVEWIVSAGSERKIASQQGYLWNYN